MENSVNNADVFYFLVRHQRNGAMDSKSDNVEITMGNETDDIIKSFKKWYNEGIETKMKGSRFVFESINSL